VEPIKTSTENYCWLVDITDSRTRGAKPASRLHPYINGERKEGEDEERRTVMTIGGWQAEEGRRIIKAWIHHPDCPLRIGDRAFRPSFMQGRH
jgi:hypothetical protein